MENLFTVNQVAFILKIHHLTVRRYIKEGKLLAVKVGGGVRVKESDLLNFQKNYSTSSQGPKNFHDKTESFFSLNDPFWRLNGFGASLSLPEHDTI